MFATPAGPRARLAGGIDVVRRGDVRDRTRPAISRAAAAGVYTRYFAEGVGGSFFDTIFSLSNFGAHAGDGDA